jgi:hypothetical protein
MFNLELVTFVYTFGDQVKRYCFKMSTYKKRTKRIEKQNKTTAGWLKSKLLPRRYPFRDSEGTLATEIVSWFPPVPPDTVLESISKHKGRLPSQFFSIHHNF